MTPRHDNGFRFRETFIKRWTRVLTWSLVIVFGGGGVLFGIGEAGWLPEWVAGVGALMMLPGLVIPLLIAAILGGESIARGGGIVGIMLIYGIGATVYGKSEHVGWAFSTGLSSLVLSVAGFWVMGWFAGVPMYIGTSNAHGSVIGRRPARDPGRSGDPAVRNARKPKPR